MKFNLSAIRKLVIVIPVLLLTQILSGQSVLDYLLEAKALTKAGKPEQSVQLLTEAISKYKDNNKLLLERAEANICDGDYSDAIADFNMANELSEHSGEFGLAKIYALKGDATTALYHLANSMDSKYKRTEKEIMLDPAFEKIENRPEWRQFWKKNWYSLSEEKISEIEYYSSIGKFEEASLILTDLGKVYPGNETTKYAESLVDLSAGRFASAIKILSGLLISDPDNEKYLRALSKAQAGQDNHAGALETYSKLLDRNVADAEILILRAGCYQKTGETAKALSDLQKYLSFYPDDKNALSMAGRMNATSGDNIKALQYFSENLKNNPNDPQCYIDRGNAYLSGKSWDWAVKDYSMALDLDPNNSETWLNKGIALLSAGNKEDACHDFRKSFTLGNKRAADYLGRHCIK